MSRIECDEVLRELQVFCDGELPVAELDAVAEHLAECGPCFDRAEFQRRFQDIIRRKCGQAELPPQLADRIRMVLAAEA